VSFILPDWPAIPGVHALCTTRLGGESKGAYDSFNLAQHVGDCPRAVDRNRALLIESAQLPSAPRWLNQVHGTKLVDAGLSTEAREADGSYSRSRGVVCTVMTADCLPLLVADKEGEYVAALHAGWRGLLGGVIEEAIKTSQIPPERLQVWLGPAIGVKAFEVGEEVYTAFIMRYSEAGSAFKVSKQGKWLADIYLLARIALKEVGVIESYGGEFCTFTDTQQFYSYRRDGVTGRMASLIWLELE
jgi:YfiH family protein